MGRITKGSWIREVLGGCALAVDDVSPGPRSLRIVLAPSLRLPTEKQREDQNARERERDREREDSVCITDIHFSFPPFPNDLPFGAWIPTPHPSAARRPESYSYYCSQPVDRYWRLECDGASEHRAYKYHIRG